MLWTGTCGKWNAVQWFPHPLDPGSMVRPDPLGDDAVVYIPPDQTSGRSIAWIAKKPGAWCGWVRGMTPLRRARGSKGGAHLAEDGR